MPATPKLTLTLCQYERTVRRSYLAENPTVRASEYDACYPRGCRILEWLADLVGDVQDLGLVVRRPVLDDVARRSPGTLGYLLRLYPSAIPPFYQPPQVRAAQRHLGGLGPPRRRRPRT